jgi:hypothetical protein
MYPLGKGYLSLLGMATLFAASSTESYRPSTSYNKGGVGSGAKRSRHKAKMSRNSRKKNR